MNEKNDCSTAMKPEIRRSNSTELDDEGSSADEVEPKLKYERLSNDLQNTLGKDSVSCVAFHPKIICIGTAWGRLFLLDHQGNTIKNEHLRAHTVAVNQICMDLNGDFIATCSDDGRAHVYGLYTSDHRMDVDLNRAIKSVALDPVYYKAGVYRRFVTGADKLVLHEKSLFNRVKSTILAEDRVLNIKWYDRFIAWSGDAGVKIFDIVGKISLVFIHWPRTEYIPEKYPCCLKWKNKTTLLIGWIDTVKVCRIEKRNSVIKDMPEFSVNASVTFHIEYFISGICPLDSSQMVILAYRKELDCSGKALKPLMYVLKAEHDNKYVEEYTDGLSLRGYQDCKCNDYHLDCLTAENRYVIAGSRDIIIASDFDHDDKIDWLVKQKKFEQAMELVVTKSKYLQRNSARDVGKNYVDYLFARKDYQKAAELCSKIFDNNVELWEKEIFKFGSVHQLRTISQYIPVDVEHKLNPHLYEMVLYEFLKLEPKNFLKLLKQWPPELYHVLAVINGVLEQLNPETDSYPVFLESLALLYTYSGQYDKALNEYLKLKHKDVFQLIRRHNLNDCLSAEVVNLMDLDSQQAIALFLEKDRISPDAVVEKLEKNFSYLYLYLDALDADAKHKLIARKYHSRLVKLYGNYAPHKLLPLLRRSNTYSIQEALQVCKEYKLYPEMVYLQDRIGNTKEALQLIVTEIGDKDEAILFCKEHNDPELWLALIEYSLSKPEFVTYLLQKIGAYVDPSMLVQRIDRKMHIPGLKHALVKLLGDYNLQVSVQRGNKNMVVSDCFNLHQSLLKIRQKGLSVDDDLLCSACNRKVIINNSSVKNNVLIFYCRHSFHEECLPVVDAAEKCIICYSQKSA